MWHNFANTCTRMQIKYCLIESNYSQFLYVYLCDRDGATPNIYVQNVMECAENSKESNQKKSAP